MQTIYLVRHGDYSNPENILIGRLPVSLNDDGVKQARKLNSFFQDKHIAKIYSSAVVRCKQTAEIIANDKIPIFYDKRLSETLSAYQGMQYENKPKWEDFFLHTGELGGEGYSDIQNRMISFFNDIVLNTTDNLIICSHRDPLWFLYTWIVKEPLIRRLHKLSGKVDPDYLENGSIRPIKIENGKILPLDIIHQKAL